MHKGKVEGKRRELWQAIKQKQILHSLNKKGKIIQVLLTKRDDIWTDTMYNGGSNRWGNVQPYNAA